MVNVKRQNGITIMSTVIAIVLLLILSSTIIVAGTNSFENMKIEKFKSELEVVEKKVDVVSEKVSAGDVNYNNIGKDITSLSLDDQYKVKNKVLNEKSISGFKYYDKEELEKLDLSGIKDSFIINLLTKEVYSFSGYNIEGITYYSLDTLEHINDK